MDLLFTTYNRMIPLAVVRNKTLKMGDIVKIRGRTYYINCQPGTITPTGKRCKFYYCVRTEGTKITNAVK